MKHASSHNSSHKSSLSEPPSPPISPRSAKLLEQPVEQQVRELLKRQHITTKRFNDLQDTLFTELRAVMSSFKPQINMLFQQLNDVENKQKALEEDVRVLKAQPQTKIKEEEDTEITDRLIREVLGLNEILAGVKEELSQRLDSQHDRVLNVESRFIDTDTVQHMISEALQRTSKTDQLNQNFISPPPPKAAQECVKGAFAEEGESTATGSPPLHSQEGLCRDPNPGDRFIELQSCVKPLESALVNPSAVEQGLLVQDHQTKAAEDAKEASKNFLQLIPSGLSLSVPPLRKALDQQRHDVPFSLLEPQRAMMEVQASSACVRAPESTLNIPCAVEEIVQSRQAAMEGTNDNEQHIIDILTRITTLEQLFSKHNGPLHAVTALELRVTALEKDGTERCMTAQDSTSPTKLQRQNMQAPDTSSKLDARVTSIEAKWSEFLEKFEASLVSEGTAHVRDIVLIKKSVTDLKNSFATELEEHNLASKLQMQIQVDEILERLEAIKEAEEKEKAEFRKCVDRVMAIEQKISQLTDAQGDTERGLATLQAYAMQDYTMQPQSHVASTVVERSCDEAAEQQPQFIEPLKQATLKREEKSVFDSEFRLLNAETACAAVCNKMELLEKILSPLQRRVESIESESAKFDAVNRHVKKIEAIVEMLRTQFSELQTHQIVDDTGAKFYVKLIEASDRIADRVKVLESTMTSVLDAQRSQHARISEAVGKVEAQIIVLRNATETVDEILERLEVLEEAEGGAKAEFRKCVDRVETIEQKTAQLTDAQGDTERGLATLHAFMDYAMQPQSHVASTQVERSRDEAAEKRLSELNERQTVLQNDISALKRTVVDTCAPLSLAQPAERRLSAPASASDAFVQEIVTKCRELQARAIATTNEGMKVSLSVLESKVAELELRQTSPPPPQRQTPSESTLEPMKVDDLRRDISALSESVQALQHAVFAPSSSLPLQSEVALERFGKFIEDLRSAHDGLSASMEDRFTEMSMSLEHVVGSVGMIQSEMADKKRILALCSGLCSAAENDIATLRSSFSEMQRGMLEDLRDVRTNCDRGLAEIRNFVAARDNKRTATHQVSWDDVWDERNVGEQCTSVASYQKLLQEGIALLRESAATACTSNREGPLHLFLSDFLTFVKESLATSHFLCHRAFESFSVRKREARCNIGVSLPAETESVSVSSKSNSPAEKLLGPESS